MKRIVFALLALTLLISMASCAETAKETETKTEEITAATQEAEEITTEETEQVQEVADNATSTLLNKAWDKMGEDKQFAVYGGTMEAPVDGKAGAIDLKNVESITSALHITEEDLGKVINAAAITHMMNANTFTCAAYQVKSDDAAAFASSLKDSIMATQWMCGFPETLVIYTVDGEYIVAAFGNGEAIDNFEAGLNEAYGASAVLTIEEALA